MKGRLVIVAERLGVSLEVACNCREFDPMTPSEILRGGGAVVAAFLAREVSLKWVPECARQGPNDPKLSDGGAWRGACPTVERTTDAQM